MILVREQMQLDNKLLRQAIAYAIDKEAVLLGSYNGYGDIAENWARAGFVFGGTTDGVTVYSYNPEKAKALLVEAGYPNGVDIGTINAIGTLYFAKAAQIIQQNLSDVGIKCEVASLEQAAVEAAFYYDQTGDAACHGDNMRIDSDIVYTGYFSEVSLTSMKGMDPEIYRLGELGKVTFDREERLKIYQQLWAAVMDQCSHIPLFHRSNPYIADRNLNVMLGVNYYYIYDWSWK